MTTKRRRTHEVDSNVPLVVSDPVSGLPKLERVWVQVAVAHDGLRAGSVHEVALSPRTSALIDVGYLDLVVPPTPLG